MEPDWPARLWWTLAGVVLLDWAFQILSGAPQFAWAAIIAILAGGWGLGTVLASWTGRLDRARSAADARAADARAAGFASAFAWGTALLTVCCFAAWAVINAHTSPGYGTDELAFDQYAAELVRHGVNPYTHSLGHAFTLFQVSPGGYTYTLAGQRVTDLSYPALSFLLYVPFLALGWSAQLGIGLNVIGLAVATLIMFALLPARVRAVALVLASVAVYMQLALIGLTDMLFLPLLVIAAYRWDRFGRGWRSYAGPVAFGLAIAVKQTPWPVLPFILLGLALDERARGGLRAGVARAGRYLLAVVLAFAAPNVPFIVAAPVAWAHGTFTPVVRSLVPAGQGLIGLTLFLHLGGGSLTAYSALLALVLLLLVVSYVGTYPLLRAATFMLPALAYFFALRSYTDYLVVLIPPALVAALTVGRAPAAAGPRAATGQARSRVQTPAGERARAAVEVPAVQPAPRSLAAPAQDAEPPTDASARGPAWPRALDAALRPRGWATALGGILRSRGWGAAIGASAALCIAAFAYALSAGSPLAIRIMHIDVSGVNNIGNQIYARVHNRTSVAVKPAFTLKSSTGVASFWHVLRGPARLAAGASATYLLGSPDTDSQFSVNSGITLVAFLQHPASVSVSNRYSPKLWHVGFEPEAFDALIPLGHPVALRARLLDRWDLPIARAGVPVKLRQAANGHARVASINGRRPGRAAVAYTNAQGVARFTLVGTATSIYPDTLSVSLPSGAPYSYLAAASDTVELRFTPAARSAASSRAPRRR